MTKNEARSELSASLNGNGRFRSNLPFRAPSLRGDHWSRAAGNERGVVGLCCRPPMSFSNSRYCQESTPSTSPTSEVMPGQLLRPAKTYFSRLKPGARPIK